MIKFTKASRISREETFEDIGDAEGGKDISFRLVFHWEEHMFLPFLLTQNDYETRPKTTSDSVDFV